MGLRRSNTTLLYASGVVGGLGFYTFPTARMAPIVLILFLVTLGPRAWKPGILAPIAVGLLVAGLPLFATDRWDAISVSQDRTVFGFQDSPSEGVLTRLYENVPRSLFGFNYNPNAGHFVSGSLLDPVAAVLLVLGLAYGLSRIRSEPYRLLAIWLIITVVFAGILSPYNRVAYDRLHLVLPVAAIYGGIAVAALLRLLQPALPRRESRSPRSPLAPSSCSRRSSRISTSSVSSWTAPTPCRRPKNASPSAASPPTSARASPPPS